MMPYDPTLVAPMREELTRLGVQELLTTGEVDGWFDSKGGTGLLVINYVCGCAAGQARPAVQLALQHSTRPDRVATVFAGQDLEATARARGYFAEFPPSSPSMVLVKDGDVVHFLPRHRIESRSAEMIAQELVEAFEKHCGEQAGSET
jgi:putative YphP/YqiW family bacilliredoxin